MDVKEIQKLAEMLAKNVNKVQPDQISKAVNTIPESTKPVPNTAKKSLFSGVGSLLKTAAPIAASFIPGVGPIASQLLSTLNDDSWFEEFKSAGAAFNEKLVTKIRNTGSQTNPKLMINARGALASIHTTPRFYGTRVQDEVGSSMIAYIRKQTNNVLADDIDSYFKVIDAYMHLYAVHFELVKWLKFAQKQPINIPMPSEIVQIIKPQNLNLLMGISESLKQYLQSTVKLPYPLVEAMRWRFGTLFHTFNTGQPGLISYDRVSPFTKNSGQDDMGGRRLTEIAALITKYQDIIAKAGRAGGDVTLAYANHINRLDIEDPHYDEKEFNLRHNIMFVDTTYPLLDLIPIIKDSRLATSPAIQASLLSMYSGTGHNLALFGVSREDDDENVTSHIAYYVDSSLTLSNTPHINAAVAGLPTTAGWYLQEFLPGQHTTTNSLAFRIDNATGPGALTLEGTDMAEHGRARLGWNSRNNFTIALQRSMGFYKTPSSQSVIVYENGVGNNYAQLIISVDQISYDLALVSPETVRSIQAAALRNLTRGSMPGPKPELTVSEVKPAITEVAKSIDSLKA